MSENHESQQAQRSTAQHSTEQHSTAQHSKVHSLRVVERRDGVGALREALALARRGVLLVHGAELGDADEGEGRDDEDEGEGGGEAVEHRGVAPVVVQTHALDSFDENEQKSFLKKKRVPESTDIKVS